MLRQLYEPKHEEGLDRFESALSKNMHEFDIQVAKSDELDDLTRSIDKANRKLAMKYRREHKYGVEMYEEQLYKEVVYDTRIDATEVEEFRYMNPLKKSSPRAGKFRNLTEVQQEASEMIGAPFHLRKRTPFVHPYPEMNS